MLDLVIFTTLVRLLSLKISVESVSEGGPSVAEIAVTVILDRVVSAAQQHGGHF